MFKRFKNLAAQLIVRPATAIYKHCVKRPVKAVVRNCIERPYNVLMNSQLRWPLLIVATLVTPVILGPVLVTVGGLTTAVATGISVLSGVIVLTSGKSAINSYDARKNKRKNELIIRNLRITNDEGNRQITERDTTIVNLRARITELTNRERRLDEAVARYAHENRAITQERDRLVAERDEVCVELNAARAELASYDAGGSRSTGVFPTYAYSTSFFHISHMHKIINKIIKNYNKNVIENNDVLMIFNQDKDKVSNNVSLVLPSCHLDSNHQMIFKSIQTAISLLKKNKIENAKILCPVLIKRHWHTLELTIDHKQQETINAFLHDPMGGGKLSPDLAELLSKFFKLHYRRNVTLLTPMSPYHSARQSKADKISCGPIVIKEIHKLIKGKTLDRPIPYAFGASEIVTKQAKLSQSNGVQHLVASRYHLLSHDIRDTIKNYLPVSEQIEFQPNIGF